MAEIFEARGIVSGAHEEEDGGAEDGGMEQSVPLGGAALQRCENWPALNFGFSR
jgi:hypothetical protein